MHAAEKEKASADVQGGSVIAEVPAQDQPEHEKAQIANPKKRKVAKMLTAVSRCWAHHLPRACMS